MDIESADVFTLRVPASRPAAARPPGAFRPAGRRPWKAPAARPAPVSRRLLDVFRVRSLSPTSDDVWERFRVELQEFVALLVAGRRDLAREQLIDRVSEALSTTGPRRARISRVHRGEQRRLAALHAGVHSLCGHRGVPLHVRQRACCAERQRGEGGDSHRGRGDSRRVHGHGARRGQDRRRGTAARGARGRSPDQAVHTPAAALAQSCDGAAAVQRTDHADALPPGLEQRSAGPGIGDRHGDTGAADGRERVPVGRLPADAVRGAVPRGG